MRIANINPLNSRLRYDSYNNNKLSFGADVKFESDLAKLSPEYDRALDYYVSSRLPKQNIAGKSLANYFTPIFRELISTSTNEEDFYLNLSKEVKKYTQDSGFVKSQQPDISEILANQELPSNPVYVDIGCGNGVLTKSVARNLGIKEENIYGIDVSKPTKATGINIFKYDGKNIPDGLPHFDIATLFVVLHHLENKEQARKLLKSIYDNMNQDGYLVIKEHEIKNEQDTAYWRVIHALKGKVMGGAYPDLDCGNLYLSSEEWEEILKEVGFEIADKKSGIKSINKDVYMYLLLAKKS